MNMNKKILPALLLAVCCWAGASAQQVAVKTNLLYWAAATPNVGAEVAVGKHSTLGFSANYNPWTVRTIRSSIGSSAPSTVTG